MKSTYIAKKYMCQYIWVLLFFCVAFFFFFQHLLNTNNDEIANPMSSLLPWKFKVLHTIDYSFLEMLLPQLL